MYQNLNHRPSTANSPKPFSIRLDPIPVNEKAVYVHSVCAALIDSRFGMGRSTPFVHDLRELPERGATVFCDLTIDGPVPCYAILPDAEMARRYMADTIRRELAQADLTTAAIRGQRLSPSNLGTRFTANVSEDARGHPSLKATADWLWTRSIFDNLRIYLGRRHKSAGKSAYTPT